MSQINIERYKKSFHAFFRQTSWIGLFKRVSKVRVGCPVVFHEGIIEIFRMKLSQIDTENDKKPKISNFQPFQAFFD